MTEPPRTDETFGICEDSARWQDILARVMPHRALDFDALTGAHDGGRAEMLGRTFFPEGGGVALCSSSEAPRAAIGVVIGAEQTDLTALAARLAALAIERECEVITLSESESSGLEPFGFRNERISGDSEDARAQCIDQIRAFWGLEIIL